MYKVVIGLEVHCQLKTNSKNFSSSLNSFDGKPNTNISVVDMGFPGILPVVNKEAVRNSLKMALAMKCKIPKYLLFDRKNYFYPDLPKGYQITQMKQPIGTNGYVMIHVDGKDKKILIHDTHLEEDTSNLDHHGTYSLINYNRAGIPLLETVTEPCMNTKEEAISFLETLRSIFLYTDTSYARSDMGQIRCDVNISLMKEEDLELGTRVEMKNINSFNSVRLAIESEIKRQTEILENGGTILQETRRFSEEDMCTYSMRSKEDAIDYKYFVEPNIPPIEINQEFLENIKKELPELQYERIGKYINDFGLSRQDATILVKDKATADYFEKMIEDSNDYKTITNWITSTLLGYTNKEEISLEDIFVTPKMLNELIDMVTSGKISSKQGKEVLFKALDEKREPKTIVEEEGMKQIGNDDEILKMCQEVLIENPDSKQQYQNGRTNILDFLVGQVMKKSRGQANPASTRKLMKEQLEG